MGKENTTMEKGWEIPRIDTSDTDIFVGVFFKDEKGKALEGFPESGLFSCCYWTGLDDFDCELGCLPGFAERNPRYEEIPDLYVSERKKEWDALYEKLSQDALLDTIPALAKEYWALWHKMKSYKHWRLGNPDVQKYNHFCKEHPEFLEIRPYDPMAWSTPPEKAMTNDERRASIRRQLDYQVANDRFFVESIMQTGKTEYSLLMETLKDFLSHEKRDFYLLDHFYEFRKDIRPVVLSLYEFTLEKYLYADMEKNYYILKP